MAETFNKLKIEINQPVTDIITAVQDDTNSRYLDVFLYDNGTPIDLTGHEVRIFVEKPATNGEQFTVWNNGEITDATAGRCQFLLTTQMLAEMGYLNVQISIWLDNTEILSTEVFHIFVTESLRSDGSIESSNEYGALVVLFQNLYESIDLMTEMVQNFGIAGDVAQQIPVTTFWEMLEAVYSMTKQAYENASVAQVLEEIGDTTDTGGTETAGTIYGKLNDIIGKTGGLNSSLGTDYFLPLDNWVRMGYPMSLLIAEKAEATVTGYGEANKVSFEFSPGIKKIEAVFWGIAGGEVANGPYSFTTDTFEVVVDDVAYGFSSATGAENAVSLGIAQSAVGNGGDPLRLYIDYGDMAYLHGNTDIIHREINGVSGGDSVSGSAYAGRFPFALWVKNSIKFNFTFKSFGSYGIDNKPIIRMVILYRPAEGGAET